jgi:hypothetical protein
MERIQEAKAGFRSLTEAIDTTTRAGRMMQMRDSEAKTNMTNTGLEKRRPNNEEELPVVLLDGMSGQSEDGLR